MPTEKLATSDLHVSEHFLRRFPSPPVLVFWKFRILTFSAAFFASARPDATDAQQQQRISFGFSCSHSPPFKLFRENTFSPAFNRFPEMLSLARLFLSIVAFVPPARDQGEEVRKSQERRILANEKLILRPRVEFR